MFEFTENEKITDVAPVQYTLEVYRKLGFLAAPDLAHAMPGLDSWRVFKLT